MPSPLGGSSGGCRSVWSISHHRGYIAPASLRYDASPPWLESRGPAAWQATPSWSMYQLTCHRSLPWLRLTFAMVPDAAWPGSDQRPWGTAFAAGRVGPLDRPSAPNPCVVVCCCPSLGAHVCRVYWATSLLFTGVPVWCVALRVQCPGPLGSCSPVCLLGMLCAVCVVLDNLAPVHRCARSVRCLGCAVSWATWLLFTGVIAQCFLLYVRCPGPLGSCSPVCSPGVFCCIPRAVSWATWLLFTGVPARCAVLCVRCREPLSSCSPVCLFGVLSGVCGVLGHLTPVHRCDLTVRCVVCAVSWAICLLFSVVLAPCVVLCVRCPGQLGFCSPVRPLGALS